MALTDKQIADIYLGIRRHYEVASMRNRINATVLATNEVISEIQHRLYYEHGNLFYLNHEDKDKIISILEVTLNSLVSEKINYREYIKSYATSKYVSTKLVLSYYEPIPIPIFFPNTSSYSNNNHSHKNNDLESILAVIVIVLLLILAVCASLEYLASNTIDCFYRITNNEGAFQASFALSLMAASTTAGTLLAFYLLSAPIACLALSAGIANPLGLIVFITICFGLISGALAQLINNFATKIYFMSTHKEALIPDDPYRFRLTTKEEKNLIDKGIDPVKVKCALVAIKHSLRNSDAPSRLSIYSSRQNNAIKTIHELRTGQKTEVTIDSMMFNLRITEATVEAINDADDTQNTPPFANATIISS